MAAFRFRLATLLRLREAARDERRTQLAEALQLAEQLRERQMGVEELLREALRVQSTATGAIDADRLLNATRYEMVLRAELQQLQLQETALQTEIEKRRQALVAADRDVRSLELLRETQQERHREQEERRAVKELDEIALRRYAAEGAE
ncbi:MAG TPA: flagellar export protein FliJ [Pirellulales bacterium]|nr:flagellar export protein FliJ [Pirellulales bacterium]